MNIQAMMKQAQKLQEEIKKEKDAIDKKQFTYNKNFINIIMTGNKKLQDLIIDKENVDLEMLEDILLVGFNTLLEEIDKETNIRLGKYTQGIPGLF
ncbi:MAG: YbaB/EbfC family nucleoid-associated protein [Bacilli bacterium]|nr:YbaB/EbfC family nucleoid-associated protein [Bacilli bacterium]